MKTKVSRIVSSISTIALTSTVISCSQAEWSERGAPVSSEVGSNIAPEPPAQPPKPVQPEKPTRHFETKVLVETLPTRPLDIVWVVDNSNSMQAEAAHVRNNIQSFATYVMNRAEVGFSVISRKGKAGTNVTLPLLSPDFAQIDHAVWSTDSLEILAASICPVTNSKGTACASIRANARTKELALVAGKLRPRLRADSKKIFVVVTDDDSRVSSELFLSAFREQFPGETPVVYGFIGLSETESQCADNDGLQYLKLAQVTSGGVFNICDRDWSREFQRLAEISVQYSVHPILISAPEDLTSGGRVLTVEVNGVVLPEGHYSLTKEGVILESQAIPATAELVIRVTYELAAQ